MNKSLVFKRAWKTHNIRVKHNVSSNFGLILSTCFYIARIVKDRYVELPNEFY